MPKCQSEFSVESLKLNLRKKILFLIFDINALALLPTALLQPTALHNKLMNITAFL